MIQSESTKNEVGLILELRVKLKRCCLVSRGKVKLKRRKELFLIFKLRLKLKLNFVEIWGQRETEKRLSS